jgi:hypothetical protein
VLKEAAAAREARELQEKAQMDDDKMFLLSLHNDLKNVPDYLKLQTKMEIMQVIKMLLDIILEHLTLTSASSSIHTSFRNQQTGH